MSASTLTTGTFNLVVKDRNRGVFARRNARATRFRLSGAFSVQNRSPSLSSLRSTQTGEAPASTQEQICLSSKPFNVTGCAWAVSTRCAHRISTVYTQAAALSSGAWLGLEGSKTRPRTNHFRRATERIFRFGSSNSNLGTSRHGR